MQRATCDAEVSVVVLSHNRRGEVERHLPILLKIVQSRRLELVIVDNASNDGTVETIKEIVSGANNVRMIFNSTNLGVSEGRNVGIRATRGQYILCVDEDILIDTETIDRLYASINGCAEFGIASPLIVDAETGRRLNISRKKGSVDRFYEAAFLVRREVIDKIGLLDPALTVAGEGLDYSLRLRRAGYFIKLVEGAKVIHRDRRRDEGEVRVRRDRWLWSFCFVYAKNHSLLFAALMCVRTFVSHARIRSDGNYAERLRALVMTARRGFRAGRLVRVGPK